MAGAVHRRPVTWAAAAGLLLATLSAGPGRASAAGSPGCPWVTQQAITTGTTPVLFVHGINSGPGSWTGTGTGASGAGPVPGTGQWPLQYVQGSLGSSKVTGYTFDWSGYSGANGTTVEWVTTQLKPSLGVRLAQAIGCIARKAGHQVIIIAHSMGGLITQDAASIDPGDIAAVFTLGTPYQGSYFASAASSQSPGGGPGPLAQAILAHCGFSRTQQGLCGFFGIGGLASETKDPGVKAMLLKPAGGWKDLPPWPASLRNRVYSLAASITGTWQPISMLNLQVTIADAGDLVVGTTSQRSSLPCWTMNCPVRLAQGSTIGSAATAFDVLGALPCIHTNEPHSKALLDYIIAQVGPMLPTAVIPASAGLAACTSAAITRSLSTHGAPKVAGWQVDSFACKDGWALAAVGAPSLHPDLYAILRQTTSGWKSDGAVDASCYPYPPWRRPPWHDCLGGALPPPAVMRFLVRKVGPLLSGAA
jgi:pimeloyl-ACP methyl ester carboxylesterase